MLTNKTIGIVISVLVTVLLFGCASTPDIDSGLPISRQPPVITYALSLQGAPYRYGKASPEEGFDCSGFVQHVYAKQGIRLPRTVQAMAEALPSVADADRKPGDLLFFNTSGQTYSHVGLFIQDDRFIHAPSRRSGHVMVSSMNNSYWRKRFVGVRRPILH